MTRSKSQFYELMIQRDAKLANMANRWLYALFAATLAPLILRLMIDLPATIAPRSVGWAFGAYMIIVLIVFMAFTRRQQERLNEVCGMKCESCGLSFEGSELIHLGFIEKCRKCGTPPFIGHSSGG